MKAWGALVAMGGLAAGFASYQPAPQGKLPKRPWTLVVGGDTSGFLSPCGCTFPMTGGIRRRATAVRQLEEKAEVVSIDTGNFVSDTGRQSEMKAETMAQALASVDTAAIAYSARDAQLQNASSIPRLAEGRVIASDLREPVEGVSQFVEQGPFFIGSASGAPSPLTGGADAVAKRLSEEAELRGKFAVLMLDASLSVATDLARRFPKLGAITYRRAGWPTDAPTMVGKVALLTPGEQGKAIARLSFDGEPVPGTGHYAVTRLGPEFKDDPEVARIFSTYLHRVDKAGLVEEIPRAAAKPFAGSESCMKCHTSAYKVWHASGHMHALSTLEKVGQARDPDCIRCHSTGIGLTTGFVSRLKTPALAAVTCESCHGPARAHVVAPKQNRLARVTAQTCMTCHTAEQSPNFLFSKYWKKIAHK